MFYCFFNFFILNCSEHNNTPQLFVQFSRFITKYLLFLIVIIFRQFFLSLIHLLFLLAIIEKFLVLRFLLQKNEIVHWMGCVQRFRERWRKTSRRPRAIANATLTMRSFEIQLKGVPSITGRRTPAPAPAASIKDRHGIYETASPADAALSANVKSISAINNSKLRRSRGMRALCSLFYH